MNRETPPSEPVLPYRATIQTFPQPTNFTSTLTVDASTITNNTDIVCRAINGATLEFYSSLLVVLKVQGKEYNYQ